MVKAAALAAALLVPLTCAAQQPQSQEARFRYLGRAGEFAVLASEAQGPRDRRALIAVAANLKPSGPRGADNATLALVFDCDANTVHAVRATVYLGEDQLGDFTATSDPIAPTPGSPNGVAFAFACEGTVPAGPAIWIDSEPEARAYARMQVKLD